MADERKMVSFDRPKLERLKKAKKEAEEQGKESFIFEGDEYLVRYAHYLIEYLEQLPLPVGVKHNSTK